MKYLKSRIHKLYALVGVMEQYVNENENPNLNVIQFDMGDVIAIAEEVLMYDLENEHKI